MNNSKELNEAINYFLLPNKKFNRIKFNNDNSELKQIILNSIKFNSIEELVYRIKSKNYIETPNCPVCGKKLKFLKSKVRFQNHCSSSCAAKDKITRTKQKNTLLLRYGDENYNNREKYTQTCLKKFGTTCSLANEECIKKGKLTRLLKYGNENYSNSEKTTETCKARYGTGRNNNKAWETMLIKYGKTSYLATDEINNMRNNTEIQNKIQLTKLKNKTFNASKAEEAYYLYLIDKYDEDNIVRQYSDSRYPFKCDFYIKSEDLFIECHFNWTHGGRPFDPNNEFCQKQLAEWQEKAKTSKFYKNAIATWTVRDTKKLSYMKNNKLNFKIIYNLK